METLAKHNGTVSMVLTIAGGVLLLCGIYSATAKPSAFVMFVIPSILLLGLRDVIGQEAKNAKTSDQLAESAQKLGAEYRDSAPFDVVDCPLCFELTKHATHMAQAYGSFRENSIVGKLVRKVTPKARHVMTHAVGEVDVIVFDYEYIDNETTAHRAVAAIKSDELAVNYFGIFPKMKWGGVARRFEGDQSRDLSRIIDTLDSYTALEVGEGCMLLYQSDKLPLHQCDVNGLVTKAYEVYTVLRDKLHSRDKLQVTMPA